MPFGPVTCSLCDPPCARSECGRQRAHQSSGLAGAALRKLQTKACFPLINLPQLPRRDDWRGFSYLLLFTAPLSASRRIRRQSSQRRPHEITRSPETRGAGLHDVGDHRGRRLGPFIPADPNHVKVSWVIVSFGEDDPGHRGKHCCGVYRRGVAKFRAMVRCSSRVGRMVAAQRLSSGSLPC